MASPATSAKMRKRGPSVSERRRAEEAALHFQSLATDKSLDVAKKRIHVHVHVHVRLNDPCTSHACMAQPLGKREEVPRLISMSTTINCTAVQLYI